MYDQEILDSQVKADRFPFQSEGDITLAVRNKNFALGPVMVHIVMKPGSVIPAHKHDGMAEALYVLEGDFINEGKEYLPGTSVHVKAGKQHGPHTTKNGARCWCFGRTKPRRAKPTSVISRSPSTPELAVPRITPATVARIVNVGEASGRP